jgi:hypothetical protein
MAASDVITLGIGAPTASVTPFILVGLNASQVAAVSPTAVSGAGSYFPSISGGGSYATSISGTGSNAPSISGGGGV